MQAIHTTTHPPNCYPACGTGCWCALAWFAGTQELAAELRRDFTKVAWHRPKATRSESKEIFLLGLQRK